MKHLNINFRFHRMLLGPILTGLLISFFGMLMSVHPALAQNYCLTFDGSTGYVSLPAGLWNSNFSNGNAITVEYWFKGSGMNSVYRVQPGSYFVAGYYNGSNTNNNHIISNDGATNGVSAGPKSTIQDGNWHHLAMTWSKNGNFTGYLDGVQVDQRAAANVDLPAMNTINCLGSLGGTTEFLTGSLDEVRIWNDVRTAQEIANNKNLELTGTEQGLVAYYKMSNGSGTTLTDNKSGNNYPGTLTGGVSWTVGGPPIILGNLEVTATLGTTGPTGYSTFKAAFDAINAGTHAGAITIKLNGNTTESTSAVLNASGTGSSSYTSVNIYPAASGLSISGNMASPLIDLNGADNVTIDGRVNATGSTKDFVITNSSTSSNSGTSTIRMYNGANNNTIKYCTIKGSSTDGSAGVIFLSATAENTGNTIDDNNITNAADANRPINSIYSGGAANTVTISNNNIYDFLSRISSSNGINLNTSTAASTISGNSFYETNTFNPTANRAYYYPIYINSAVAGFTVSGNYIGGNAPLCAGTFTKSNTAYSNLVGIYLNSVGTGTPSVVKGNTVNGFNWSNNNNDSFWQFGIVVNAGDVTVGASGEPNTIGSMTGTPNMTFNFETNGNLFVPICLNGSGYITCQYNNIGGITCNNVYSNQVTRLHCIYRGNNNVNAVISNNTIGSSTNPITLTSPATGDHQFMTGIYNANSATSGLTVNNNSISYLDNQATSGNQNYVCGILSYGMDAPLTISGNNLHDLTTSTSNNGSGIYACMRGIFVATGTQLTLTNNTIHNLTNTNSTFNGYLYGIYATGGGTSITNDCSGNTVYNVSSTGTGSGPFIYGIYYGGGNFSTNTLSRNYIYGLSSAGVNNNCWNTRYYGIYKANSYHTITYANNIISLGGDTRSTIYGIYEESTSGYSSSSSTYFNTIFISGSPSYGDLSSYAFYSAGNVPQTYKNNVFYNARSNNGTSGNHYCLYYGNTPVSTSDYNDLYAPAATGYVGFYNGNYCNTLTAWKTVTGGEAHSLNINPSFASAGGSSATDYLPSASSLVATAGTGITTDYDGGADRSATYPAMGAFEYNVTPPCANPSSGGTISAAQTICSGFAPAAFTSSAAASGHTGTLEYKWQVSTTSSSSGFSDISTSNAETYTPVILSATSWYKRLARADCTSDWTGAATSNVIQITVKPLPADQTVSPASQSICSGTSATISIGSSETNTNYYLRNNSDNTIIDGPKAGTGASVNFNTGALVSDKTYHILAVKADVNSTALSMDGVNEYVLTPNVSMGNTWTYETLIKPNDPSPNWSGIITSNSSSGSGMWFQFALNGSGKLLWESADPGLSIDGIGPVINDNAWHHVAVTCDGTNIRFYTDGVLVNTTGFGGGTMNRPLHIMAERQPAQYIPGLVDQTMVWNYARSLAQIQSDKITLLTGTESGLILYYTYENGTGSTVTDIAGGDHNGTLMNMENGDWIVDGDPLFTSNTCPITLSSTATVTISGANPTIAAAGSDQTVCASSATLAGNTATSGTGTWTKTSGTATISDPSSPTSGLTGISGTAILRWTIATVSCGSSFDEVSVTNSLPTNQTVTAISPICPGSSSIITLGSSQSGVYYTLRDNSNNAVIAGPTAGTGAALNFNTGTLNTDKAYNVLATISKGALAFTGNSGLKKVSLGATLWTNNFQGKNKATVEAWVYRTATGSLHTIVGNYEGSYPFLFRIDNDRIALFVNSSSWVGGATTLAINKWYHLAGTYDGTNLKVYVNGVLDGTAACSGNFISTAAELKIGGGLSNNSEYFPGSISDVRLWSVARTAAEISASYNLDLVGNESGLVALYKMGEGAGSTLSNSATGNLYPGTLVNSPAWVAGPSAASACSLQMTNAPTVTVTPNITVNEASSAPSLCIGTALTAITHTTTGATEIGVATGLPAGVTAAFASNTITISGTPTASGTYNYSIPITGGCGSGNATGTITVNLPAFVPAVRHISDLTATGQNIKWYAAAMGGTALASSDVLPTGTTHYYASQTVSGVESTARFDVTATIDPTPCAPTGAADQDFCFAATIADLTATGSNIRWYTTSAGGTALSPSTLLSAGTYYATQTIDCTESASRLAMTVTLTPLATPSIGGPATGYTATQGYFYNAFNATGTKLWIVTGGTILQGQGTTMIKIQWTSSGTQTITIQVTNGSCQATNSKQVSVTPTP